MEDNAPIRDSAVHYPTPRPPDNAYSWQDRYMAVLVIALVVIGILLV